MEAQLKGRLTDGFIVKSTFALKNVQTDELDSDTQVEIERWPRDF